MGRELMQRYYFDVRDEDDLFQDKEGRDFQNIEAVHQAAAHCLGDMTRDALRNPKREGSRNQRMTIEVRNSRRARCQCELLICELPPAISG
jgi:hypothetical protein